MHAKLRADAAFISKCQHFSHESQLKFYAAGGGVGGAGGDWVGVEVYGLGESTLHATRQMFAEHMHIYAIGSVCVCVCVCKGNWREGFVYLWANSIYVRIP